jgi:hypothetical protein
VIVHVLAAPAVTLAGAHASDDTLAVGVTLNVAVALEPSVALTVTVCVVATEAAVAVNVADDAAEGTVTEAGTGNAAVLVDESVATLPPAGAGCVSVTVQVVSVPEVTLAGTHATEETLALGVTVTSAELLSPRVAVRVTVWDVATEPAVTVKAADIDVAGTATEPGTGIAVALLEESATTLPPAGAA